MVKSELHFLGHTIDLLTIETNYSKPFHKFKGNPSFFNEGGLLKIAVLIVLSSFFISCHCNKYYSNSDKKKIEGKLIDINYCKITANVISTNPDYLDMHITFKNTKENKIDWGSIKIYPIINKDTLQFDSSYESSAYYFKYNSDKYKNSKLNLSIKYKLKGNPVIKEEIYKELEQIRSCYWSLAFH